MKLWCDFHPSGPAAALLKAGVKGHEVLFAGEGHFPGEAEVALGQPNPADILAAKHLRWLHISSAGYTKFDFPEFWQTIRARQVLVSNSSSVFADPCAQHALAMMLAFARALPWALLRQFPVAANEAAGQAARAPAVEPAPADLPGWMSDPLRKKSFLLNDQKVVLVGYGAIGRRLAELLAPLTAHVVGIRRRPRGDEPIPMAALSAMEPVLASADHVVNLLPHSAETTHFFNAARLGQIRPGAFFYNIGRGQTVDQPALIAALASGRLAAAYLDVTDPEPLPPDHPLWTAPNCFITPHTAGGHVNERARLVAHFLENLRRYEKGEPLVDALG